MVDEGGGDVAEFAVGVLGDLGQDREGVIGTAAALAHQDALVLLYDRPRVHGFTHLLG